MARRHRVLKLILGVLLGFILTQLIDTETDSSCSESKPQVSALQLIDLENVRASNKNLIFVGVMTAAQYLDTRAKAAYETWGREVPGKVMFFSSEGSRSDHVPLVALSGVDDSYPPQKKSFMMLKYMYEHFGDQYEWFVRADDDVYIRTDRLEELLRSVDSRKPWFIGQTGRGNDEEFGRLSLDSDENFCMGGPGVVMSRETLRRTAPHAEECLETLYTHHEDVELGRCVRRYADVACTWSYEASDSHSKMQVILYHNQSGEAAFSGNLKQKEVHKAITLHPIKHPQHMYRLHNYFKGLRIQKDQQESIVLHRDLAMSMQQLGYRISSLDTANLAENLPLFPIKKGSEGFLGDTSILGAPLSLNRYSPRDLKDVLEWELISKTLYSHRDGNPRKRIGTSMKEGLSDIVREVMELINAYSNQRGRVIDFKDILYGYWRLDPVYGVDLILDLLLVYRKYRGHKMTVQVRRHAYVQQTFTGIFVREIDTNTYTPRTKPQNNNTETLPVHKQLVHQIFSKLSENLQPILSFYNTTKHTKINFILPLSGRFEIFKRFMTVYETTCLSEAEPSKLFVILYRDENAPEDFQQSVDLVENLRRRYRSSELKVVEGIGAFSRGRALQLGVDKVEEDGLMFFVDVDIVFEKQSLQRMRRNTVRSKQVYFPIVYSLYDPRMLQEKYNDIKYSVTPDIVNEDNGFWRQFGFGLVSIYKSDFKNLGGFNLMITGWGYEDVSLFDDVVKSGLRIVRTADPGLVHVFHSVKCDDGLNVEQKNMCLGTKASTLGSLNSLQKFFMKYKDLFR